MQGVAAHRYTPATPPDMGPHPAVRKVEVSRSLAAVLSAPSPPSTDCALPLRRVLGASPLLHGANPAALGVWHSAPSRPMVVPVSLPFGPSPARLSRPCPLRLAVGSEVARLRAGHRPPLNLHVRFSRMQLSRRLLTRRKRRD